MADERPAESGSKPQGDHDAHKDRWGPTLRAGSWEALEAIHVAHAERLTDLARAFGFAESDAEDAVQEAFLRVWRYREQAPLEAPKLSSWLTAILANCCKESILKKQRWQRLRGFFGLSRTKPAPTSPDALLQSKEFFEKVSDAVEHLDPLDRMVLMLARVEGLKSPEIAKMLELQSGTVRVRLFRAMQQLRKLLEENEEW